MSNNATLATKFGKATVSISPSGNVSLDLDIDEAQPNFMAERSGRSSFATWPVGTHKDEASVTGKTTLVDASGGKVTLRVYSSGKVTLNFPGPWQISRIVYPHGPGKKKTVARFKPSV